MIKSCERQRYGVQADSLSDYTASRCFKLDHLKEIKLEILDNELLNVENTNLLISNQSKYPYVKKGKQMCFYVKINFNLIISNDYLLEAFLFLPLTDKLLLQTQ